NGCYVEPTIVEAKPTDRVSQEEVFGPFMSVTTFRTDEEALAIANGTEYGLGAGLWTRDLQRAHLIAREIHSGMVWVNCYKRVSPGSPFGG
ncbi:aldehyde dehydrogenase family protein, partial [Burkholderia sp. SIMBA_057]